MILLSVLITSAYAAIIIGFILGSFRVKEFNFEDRVEKQGFSIIIPFRNEETNLDDLLNSFAQLNYPRSHYELLFVDDASTDRSLELIENFKKVHPTTVCILPSNRRSESPKKDAITTAINEARFEWILTTDADCRSPKNWLQCLNAFIDNNSCDMIVAPVQLRARTSFLDSFQALDILSLQGVTIGAFGLDRAFLCNGANLCYKKELFNALDGFNDHLEIASGDDVFFLQKVVQSERFSAAYLKSFEAIVSSTAEPNWKALLEQRKRWAAKTSSYRQAFSKLVALVVFSMNTLLIILLVLALTNLFSWKYFAYFFLVKFIFDLFLIVKTASFFKQFKTLTWYPMSSLVYPFFSMFVALSSMLTSYQWKGRTFKK